MSVKNSKGIEYFLHLAYTKTGGTLYYFSKVRENSLPAIPTGFVVSENQRTGLPFLKKALLVNKAA